MTEPQKTKESWWQTVPGFLGGLAALITAIVGAYVAVNGHVPIPNNNIDQPNPQPPAPIVTNNATPKDNKNPSRVLSDPCKNPSFDERPIKCLGERK